MRSNSHEVPEDALDLRIKQHLADYEARLTQILKQELTEATSRFALAFPEGDPDGHRRYHETQIAYMQSRIKFWEELRNKTLIGIVWMFLLAAGGAALEYAKIKLGLKL